MPVSYSFHGRVFRLDCVAEYTSEELRRTYAAALDDPNFPPNAVFLLDVTRSESLVGRSSEDIRETAGVLGPRAGKFGKRCAIVASKDVYYGLMRMAGAFGEAFGVATAVFRTEKEALEWLRDASQSDCSP